MYVAIAAAQALLGTVAVAAYAPVALTVRYAEPWEISLPPPPVDTVPRVVKLPVGVNVTDPLSIPNDPIRSSFAWAVVAVAREVAEVPVLVLFCDLSKRVAAIPVTENAATSFRWTLGCVTVIVLVFVRAFVTVVEKMIVRIPTCPVSTSVE